VEYVMRRRLASTLTALACGLALAGCSSGTNSNSVGSSVTAGSADAFIPQLNSFTEELLAKVEQAPDTKAGVAEAQALLDARKEGLVKSIGALKQDARARAPLLEAEVDNTDRVHRLQLKYADAAARDAELKTRLERLIGDYDALFR
jgi:hypothetical protein